MSKIVNPSDKPVAVARWVVAPNGSKATHSLTGQVVDQLPDVVAGLPVVKALVERGVLVEDGSQTKSVPVDSGAPKDTRIPSVRPFLDRKTKKHGK